MSWYGWCQGDESSLSRPRAELGAGPRGGTGDPGLAIRGMRGTHDSKIAIWYQRRQGDHFPQYDALTCGGDARGPGRAAADRGSQVPFRARIMASAGGTDVITVVSLSGIHDPVSLSLMLKLVNRVEELR